MATDKKAFSKLGQVTSMDIYDGASSSFHPRGLYSTDIFGLVDEPDRAARFGFMDLNTTILHPITFTNLIRLKGLYKGIMFGTAYAVWSNKEKDFIASDVISGETGYSFFMSKWKEIKHQESLSDQRALRIKFMKKFRELSEIQYLLILPAGLRDLTIDDNGRPVENEFTVLYRKLLAISNSITKSEEDDALFNTARMGLQKAFNELYELIETLLSGKTGIIQSKWTSRNVYNGTRNVITAMDTSGAHLDGGDMSEITDTRAGLYQCLKGALPVSVRCLKEFILDDVFHSADGTTQLVNKKTKHLEAVSLSLQERDQWLTVDGIEKFIHEFGNIKRRHSHVRIGDSYLALIYQDDKYYKVIRDIDHLPEGLDKDKVRPITWCELFYLATYKRIGSLYAVNTRYPVADFGSTYVSTIHLMSTVNGLRLQNLDNEGNPIEGDITREFPMTLEKGPFMDTLQINISMLGGLNADFDGDTTSFTIVYGDEAVAECRKYMNSFAAYLDPRGGLFRSAASDTLTFVLNNFTGDSE